MIAAVVLTAVAAVVAAAVAAVVAVAAAAVAAAVAVAMAAAAVARGVVATGCERMTVRGRPGTPPFHHIPFVVVFCGWWVDCRRRAVAGDRFPPFIMCLLIQLHATTANRVCVRCLVVDGPHDPLMFFSQYVLYLLYSTYVYLGCLRRERLLALYCT